MTMTMTLWKSPGGILHRRQRCSGNGQPKKTKRVKITLTEWDQACADRTVCRCALWAGWKDED
jgi:hypothetical protein